MYRTMTYADARSCYVTDTHHVYSVPLVFARLTVGGRVGGSNLDPCFEFKSCQLVIHIGEGPQWEGIWRGYVESLAYSVLE